MVTDTASARLFTFIGVNELFTYILLSCEIHQYFLVFCNIVIQALVVASLDKLCQDLAMILSWSRKVGKEGPCRLQI